MSQRQREPEPWAEFLNAGGEYYGGTLAAEWHPPERVELSAGVLTIQSQMEYWSPDNPGQVIRPPHNLLDSFLNLAADKGMTVGDMLTSSTASDRAVGVFATRYGGLLIFSQQLPDSRWPVITHREDCVVWQYFAKAMGSMLRIAAELYRGRSGLKEDWDNIHQVPPVMHQRVHRSAPTW
jgi:hypothetical protein